MKALVRLPVVLAITLAASLARAQPPAPDPRDRSPNP